MVIEEHEGWIWHGNTRICGTIDLELFLIALMQYLLKKKER